jgi:hypothetical protein
MKKQLSQFAALSLGLLLCNGLVAAQGRRQPQGEPGFGPPRGEGQQRPGGPPPFVQGPGGGSPLWGEINEGRVIKGAPFSAQVAIESLQTLGDGTRITNKTNATLARDNEGRTRREVTLNIGVPFIVEGETPRVIFINDVVTGAQYILQPNQHIARKMQMPTGRPPGDRKGGLDIGPPPNQNVKLETLGKQTIEGVEAEGTRTTITIPVGQIGNDRPIEIVSERWFATALQIPILSKHKDPRVGETVSRVTNINRAEPAKTLFEIPADYQIQQGGFPGDPRGGFRGGPPPNDGMPPRNMKRPPNS